MSASIVEKACERPRATIAEVLMRHASTRPDDVAYSFLADGTNESSVLTYRELLSRSLGVAQALQGISQRGDRVVLAYPPSIEFLSAFLGCFFAGLVPVPAYPPHRTKEDRRIPGMIEDCGARLVLTEDSQVSAVKTSLSRVLRNGSMPEVLALGEQRVADADAWDRKPSDGLAYLQYTSGSTSSPKGVRVSHQNLILNILDLDHGFVHDEDSVMVTWLPSFHDMGLIYGLLLPLYFGFPCVMIPAPQFIRKPLCWLQAMTKYRATHCAAPNFAFEHCCRRISAEDRKTLDLSHLQSALIAAEPIRPATIEEFQETFADCGLAPRVLTPGYGLAEATLKVSSGVRGEPVKLVHVDRHSLATGRIMELDPATHAGSERATTLVGCGGSGIDTEVRIVNPERGTPSEHDEVGEIWVRGDTVASGYWRDGEDGFARLEGAPEQRFLRTGDLGFMRDGHLFISGRLKDVIIVRGRNIYPQDIEFAVEKSDERIRHAGVACFGLEGRESMGVVVVAELERRSLRDSDHDEIFARIRADVSELCQVEVRAVALVKPGGVPKTSSGKVQRQFCRKEYEEDNLPVVSRREWHETSAADTDILAAIPGHETASVKDRISRWIVSWLAARQGIKPNAELVRTPMAELGLDSVAAVEMVADLEVAFGRTASLDAVEIWNYPTIGNFASYAAMEFDGKRDHARASETPARRNIPAESLAEQDLEQQLVEELELSRSLRD